MINYVHSFCSNIFHLNGWKKVIAVFVVHAGAIFSILGKFHCKGHNYYWHDKDWKDITSGQEGLLLTQRTKSKVGKESRWYN